MASWTPIWEPLVYMIKRCTSEEPFWPRSQLLKNSSYGLKRLIGYFTWISWQSHSFLSGKSLTGWRMSVAIILSCLLKVIALIVECVLSFTSWRFPLSSQSRLHKVNADSQACTGFQTNYSLRFGFLQTVRTNWLCLNVFCACWCVSMGGICVMIAGALPTLMASGCQSSKISRSDLESTRHT